VGLDKQLILSQIRGSSEERQRSIGFIVADAKLRDDILKHVISHGGTDDDGRTVLHDSVLVFVKRIFSDHDFVLESSVEAYIFGIARLQWQMFLRKNKQNPLSQAEEIQESHVGRQEQFVIDGEKYEALQKVLSKISPKCREVLLYWAGGYSMLEIAKLCGYESDGMARKKKCECFKSLVKLLQDHPSLLKQLKE
jgi:RNA polymerase sigma factor (sigma-70 family)